MVLGRVPQRFMRTEEGYVPRSYLCSVMVYIQRMLAWWAAGGIGNLWYLGALSEHRQIFSE